MIQPNKKQEKLAKTSEEEIIIPQRIADAFKP
jgi:hypothetical protein